MVRSTLGALALLCGLGGSGCTSGTAPRADVQCLQVEPREIGPQGRTPLKAESVVDGLEVPWAVAFLPNGDMLVSERPGRIRMVKDGALTPPVATLPVFAEGEAGLLGIVADPDFAQNNYFYIYATVRGPSGIENRIERWRLASDGASAAQDKILVAGIQAAPFNNGGRLRFGPDGKLYASTGDAQNPELAQSPGSLAGKILRMTRDGDIPPDNPSQTSTVYLTGVRDVQGFAWPGDGSLLVADDGPPSEQGRVGYDEITRARPGDNLGWPGALGCQTVGRSLAASVVWEGAAPPGGATMYTGEEIPEWKGSLLVAMLGAKQLHRISFDREDPHKLGGHEVYFSGDPPTGLGRLRDAVMGPDGALYVTTSNCDGQGVCPQDGDKIYRIRRWSPPATPIGLADRGQ